MWVSLQLLCRTPRLKPDAIPKLFPGSPNFLSRSTPDSDKITSYSQLLISIRGNLKPKYSDVLIQIHDSHVMLYKFKEVKDVNFNPVVSFCLRIFEDMSVRLWINGSEVRVQELQWLLSHTRKRLALWSQLFGLLKRYSKNIPDSQMISNSTMVTLGDTELVIGIVNRQAWR